MADEFEISLFGPGYGESVVVHLGQGKWLINDSCLNEEKSQPAALEYLKSIGVDCGKDVALVVASHWHDDHIRGLADIVEACSSATFVCSSAIGSREFLELVKSASRQTSFLGSGVDEFRRVVGTVGTRRKTMRNSMRLASADATIWADPANSDVRVHALSPSSAETLHALQEIGNLIPEVADLSIRVPRLAQNGTSVVLWIDFGSHRALFGGDLETTASEDRGWKSICLSDTRPHGQAVVYKVAHHGSKNAHHDEIFSKLLHLGSISILAPFKNGSVSLPTEADRKRLCASSSAVYSSNIKLGTVRRSRDKTVERVLREDGLKVELIDPSCGQIRLRRTVKEGEWRVEFGGSAGVICSTLTKTVPPSSEV